MESAIELLRIIEENGFQARIVGGAVRDYLSHLKVGDIDIATTALSQQIHCIADRYQLPYYSLGEKFGSCRVKYEGRMYEITALRNEPNGYENILFTDSFEVDSARRDFTINAMYMDSQKKIFDFHDGMNDLQNHNVKFIGDPQVRIAEDPLRVLRYIRFGISFGDYKIDKDIILKNISLLDTVSPTKINYEMIKILAMDTEPIFHILRPILKFLYHAEISKMPEERNSGKEILYAIVKSSQDKIAIAKKYGLSLAKIT